MPAGWPGEHARRSTPSGLIAVASGLCLILLAAACSASASQAGQPAPGTSPASQPALSPHAPAPVPMALQITPAAYQLPSGIAREVVLAQDGRLLIAGGLTQRSATTDAITVLNPATGELTRAGRLAAPTHDAAGAILAGRPYVFGGGVQASVAGVQAPNPPSPATATGQLPRPHSASSAVPRGAARHHFVADASDGVDAVVHAEFFKTGHLLVKRGIKGRVPGMKYGNYLYDPAGASRAAPWAVVRNVRRCG